MSDIEKIDLAIKGWKESFKKSFNDSNETYSKEATLSEIKKIKEIKKTLSQIVRNNSFLRN